MGILFYICLFLFIGLCALLCLVILVQESKSMGLGASFGGDAGDSIFGTSTAAVFKKFTAWLAIFFAAACMVLSSWSSIIAKKPHPAPTAIEKTQP